MIAIFFLGIMALVTMACMSCLTRRREGGAEAGAGSGGYFQAQNPPRQRQQQQRSQAQVVRHPDGQLSIAVL